ncbi:unnamed protein product, partial [Scytosiphon promiscuus]
MKRTRFLPGTAQTEWTDERQRSTMDQRKDGSNGEKVLWHAIPIGFRHVRGHRFAVPTNAAATAAATAAAAAASAAAAAAAAAAPAADADKLAPLNEAAEIKRGLQARVQVGDRCCFFRQHDRTGTVFQGSIDIVLLCDNEP